MILWVMIEGGREDGSERGEEGGLIDSIRERLNLVQCSYEFTKSTKVSNIEKKCREDGCFMCTQ